MNRLEFMTELNALLQDMPKEEREEALQYYNDYFEDAGVEKENDVIKELGSPKKVADMLHAGLEGQDEENFEYRETGYADTRFENHDHPAERREKKNYTDRGYYYANVHTEVEKQKPWTNKWVKLILIILIVCIGGPILIPLALGILALILGIIVAVGILAVGILITGVAITISGVIVLFAAVPKLFVSVPAAFAYAGIGFLMIALGAVITAFTWWVTWKIIPPLFRWFVNLCKRIFIRNKKEAQA